MPTLAQLSGSSSPILTTVQSNGLVVEPLDGPTSIDDVMDRFPEEVYQQGRDTHLYRFLQALGGDSGAGLVKKLAFGARLYFEAEGLQFKALDDFFSGQFNFSRLHAETYDLDTSGALTPSQWDAIGLADQSYKQRIAEYFTSTRRGNSPEGMRMMGQAGTGIECEIVENYRWIFDQLSDDPLGLTPVGTTASTAEFILIPRFLNLSSDIYDEGYEQTLAPQSIFADATFPNARPALGGASPSVTGYEFYSTPQTRLNPEIERNAIDLFDQLRSVGTLATILPEDSQFINVAVAGDPFASSTRINVSRFVTGKAGVPWPDLDAQGNHFIETGVEKEAGFYLGAQHDLPATFHKVEGVWAYTNNALADPLYGPNAFYDASSGIAPYDSYRSEFVGNYSRILTAIYPFLLNLNPDKVYSVENAIAAQTTPLVLEGRVCAASDISPDDILVNGTYPLSFFSLPGVDPIPAPDTTWWASNARFAATDTFGQNYLAATKGGLITSEILEVDLGSIREVNYINLDVLRAPIDITVEYDDIGAPDRPFSWQPVKLVPGMPYDDHVTYDPDNRTSWLNAEFNFADAKGNMVHTRHLRITFTRRDEIWPTSATNPFAWPILAKHFRCGRYVSQYLDTVGPLLAQDTPQGIDTVTLESIDDSNTRDARQRFVFPADAERGDQVPNLLGFGILVQTNTDSLPFDQSQTNPTVQFQWSLWDVTDSPVQLRTGVVDGVIAQGLSWLDFYLEEDLVVEGDLTVVYELRISSLNPDVANTVFTHSPATLSTVAVPGTLDFTNGSTSVSTSVDTRDVVKIDQFIVKSDAPEQVYVVNGVTDTTITLNIAFAGTSDAAATGNIVYPASFYDDDASDYVLDASENLVCRIWADVADSGRDVLGNGYRYGTRRDLARYVLDNTRAGWMSEPSPTPNAVEALYFDVRSVDDDDNNTYSTIDAVRVAPRTPGVQMNVYYSQQNLDGLAPATEIDWDYLLWQPVQASYVLRRSEVIQLPQQIRAAYVKLEFTNLNPQPFRVPTFPAMPPKSYRTFPQWVIDQFNSTTPVADSFLQAQTTVQTTALQHIASPTYEFYRDQRSLLAQLALGAVSNSQVVSAGLASVAGAAAIDKTTAQQIFLNIPGQYQNTQLISVDQNTLLGKIVIGRYDPTLFTDPIEATARMANLVAGDVPYVSTMNDRLSEAYQGLVPGALRFNQLARHTYDAEQAEFNKKAYFVGIDTIQFLRNDYAVKSDDLLVEDNLFDDQMLTLDTWSKDTDTGIEDGETLYVSYTVNPTVVDEAVVLTGFAPVQLQTVGGPAYSVVVYSQPAKQGLQYFQGQDYDLVFGYNLQGNRTTSIVRSALGHRLGVPLQIINYQDAGTVIGHSVIPSPPTYDAGTVIGHAVISDQFEGPFVPNFGTGTFGGGTFGDLRKQPTETGTVTGHAVITSVDTRSMVEAGTVIGVAVISGVDLDP